jgi:peptide/nickel transport system ATP-binding protein
MNGTLLSVRNLTACFDTARGVVRAVDGVSFDLGAGAALGIVGGSGSGKSTLLSSIVRLFPSPAARIESGQVLLRDRDLLALSEGDMAAVRGRAIAIVFQGVQALLNPAVTIGKSLGDVVARRDKLPRHKARHRSGELLGLVGIGSPEAFLRCHPHQLSVGMRQRVGIAMALACKPDILLCDEPGDALDAITRGQVFDLIRRLQSDTGMALVVATHDLGVAAELAREIIVMEGGRAIDGGSATEIVARHRPSTLVFEPACSPAMHDRIPGGDLDAEHPGDGPHGPSARPSPHASKPKALLRVDNLAKFFPTRHGIFGKLRFVRAVDGVSLYIRRGETLGVVGESGSGKTTMGRTVLRLTEPTYGRVVVDGKDVVRMRPRELRAARKTMQIIQQDPSTALDPGVAVFDTVAEGIRIHHLAPNRDGERARVLALLESVGLPADIADRRTEEISAGERRKVTIARALAIDPGFIVCDDPASSLDPTARALILTLLRGIQVEKETAFLFITRDLSAARLMSHRIAVMYLGRIVEMAKTNDLFEAHRHPYTHALLSTAPSPDDARKRLRVVLEGEAPSALDPPAGCAFHPRCPRAHKGKCDAETPPLDPVASGSGHRVACFFPLGRTNLLPDLGSLA